MIRISKMVNGINPYFIFPGASTVCTFEMVSKGLAYYHIFKIEGECEQYVTDPTTLVIPVKMSVTFSADSKVSGFSNTFVMPANTGK